MELTTALFILNLVISKRTNADVQLSCSEKSRKFIATEGHALSGHVISTFSVNLLPDCHDLCLQALRCLSYNYEYKSTSSSHVCEINDATENICSGSLVRRSGFKYYEEKSSVIKQLLDEVFVISGIIKVEDSACTRMCSGSSTDTDETSFQVTFPGKSVTDYITHDFHRCVPPLTAFTVCMWLRTIPDAEDDTSFSYSVPGNDNEIVIYNSAGLGFYIKDDYVQTETAVNDGQWHHICATWETTAGTWNMYIGGALKAKGDNLKTGHVIDNNGIVILGQDQDNYGGGFEQDESFSGQMYGVNMWNRVLRAEEISHMSANCSYGVGNYLRWSDFVAGLHGNVKITSWATCVP